MEPATLIGSLTLFALAISGLRVDYEGPPYAAHTVDERC